MRKDNLTLLQKIAKIALSVFLAFGVSIVGWVILTSDIYTYMTIEIRQIITGFVIKGALAAIGFVGIRSAFLHLISTLRKHNFTFEHELARAIFYSIVFFALAFFLALILI